MFERLVAFSAGLMMESEFILAYHKLSLDVRKEKKCRIWFSTQNILKIVNRLWNLVGYCAFHCGLRTELNTTMKMISRQNADIIIFHLILHAWSNRSEIYKDWRMKERTYLGWIEPGSATYQSWHDTIGVCSWSEALADLMNNYGQTQAPLGIGKTFHGDSPSFRSV